MAPVDWSWSESYASPVFTMEPQHPHGISNLGHYTTPVDAPLPLASMPTIVNQLPILAPAPISSSQWHVQNNQPFKNARKRSRDDMGWDDADSSSRSTTAPFPSARQTPSPRKTERMMDDSAEWVQQYASEGGPQNGIWAEELSERLRSSGLTRDEGQSRPGLESRKSIRLDRSESVTEVMPSDAMTNKERRFSIQDSLIDAASLALGVGWSTIPADSTMAQASRGWARHIERHFPLRAVKIVWKSTLPAYLVEAVTDDARERSISPVGRSGSPWNRQPGSNGYYLFDEKLSQGKLIAKSWGKALDNLRAIPMVFDGVSIMEADADEAQRHTETNNIQHWAGWKPAIPVSAAKSAPIIHSMEVTAGGMDLD